MHITPQNSPSITRAFAPSSLSMPRFIQTSPSHINSYFDGETSIHIHNLTTRSNRRIDLQPAEITGPIVAVFCDDEQKTDILISQKEILIVGTLNDHAQNKSCYYSAQKAYDQLTFDEQKALGGAGRSPFKIDNYAVCFQNRHIAFSISHHTFSAYNVYIHNYALQSCPVILKFRTLDHSAVQRCAVSFAFSHNGRNLVYTTKNSVSMIDMASYTRQTLTFNASESIKTTAMEADFSPDGKRLALCNNDNIYIFNVHTDDTTGKITYQLLQKPCLGSPATLRKKFSIPSPSGAFSSWLPSTPPQLKYLSNGSIVLYRNFTVSVCNPPDGRIQYYYAPKCYKAGSSFPVIRHLFHPLPQDPNVALFVNPEEKSLTLRNVQDNDIICKKLLPSRLCCEEVKSATVHSEKPYALVRTTNHILIYFVNSTRISDEMTSYDLGKFKKGSFAINFYNFHNQQTNREEYHLLIHHNDGLEKDLLLP